MSAAPFDQVRQQRAAAALDADIAEHQAQDLEGWPVPLQDAAGVPDLPAELLPGWLGRYVAAVAASTQTPTALAAGMALSVVATAVQRRFRVAPKGLDSEYREAMALWSLSVAASGSRKSAIVDAFIAPLLHWEKRAADRMRREINGVMARILIADARIKALQAAAGKAEELHRTRAAARADRDRGDEQARAPVSAAPVRLRLHGRAPANRAG